MAKKERRRGISVGTAVMLLLSFLTLAVSAGIFLRISGNIGEISLDASLLTRPLEVESRSIPEDQINQGASQDDPPPVTEATPEPAATPEPTQPPTRTLELSATGQVFFGAELRTSARGPDSGTYQFDSIFTHLEGALGADLSIATLRTGLVADSSTFETYTAPASILTGLSNVGVNLVNLATDRLLDQGMQGVLATCDALAAQGMASVGVYRDAAARDALLLQEINGIRVGIVSYTAAISTAGRNAASDEEIGTATRMLVTQATTADIASLRAQGAQLIIVLAHWGARGDTVASQEMRDTANALVTAGADIVLGTNPTRVLPIERKIITDADGRDREVFIAYSLGNLLIDESRDTTDITGIVLHLSIQWDNTAQRATIADAWYMPTWIMRYRDSEGSLRYRLVPAGAATTPANMTDAIYVNMVKSYQSLVNTIGQEVARPVQGPAAPQ